ncbi:lipopolysaccharide assembly protein LapA domain-containing protein, partial [Litorivivens sp.]
MGLLKKLLFVLFILALVFFGAAFSVENDARVPLDLLFVKLPELRVSIWIVAAFVAGGGAGLLICMIRLLQIKAQHQGVCRKLA